MRTNSMFHRPMKLLAVGGLLFATLLAGQTAFAQTIFPSKHNLSTTGTGTIRQTTGTTETCVFCHTPHGATTGSTSGGLLWNRVAPPATTYTLYTSATVNSVAIQPMGSSRMCFSCHDGVTSIDNVVNRPGSGGQAAAAVWGAPYVWSAGMLGALTGATNIGGGASNDLSNDHPIGVAYCGGFTGTGACNDADFKQTVSPQQLNRRTGTAAPLTGLAAGATGTAALTDTYWIDTTGGTVNSRDKTDMILYAQTFVTPAGINPSVQCASCHEPHMGITTVANDGLTSFLRMPNANSNLCLACHTK